MYETLAMKKPGTTFAVEDMHRLLLDVAATGEATVERKNNCFHVVAGDGWLDIGWSNAPHVVVESDEIAERFGVPSCGCTARFEMAGDDPDMDLFNDYLLINERLQATGGFVIFDTQECKLLFDEA